jgi:hypothetical protein
MTIRGQAPTEPFATSPNDKASRALVYDVPASDVPRHRVGASPATSNCDATVIAPIRHKLRAIATESGPGKGLNAVNLVRPLVCRFLDAGITRGASCSGGRRPKSAKARSRGEFGAGWAASAMGI